jgi:nucleoside 2-deoxyribosyltransferase
MKGFCEDKINDGKIKELCCPNMVGKDKCKSVIREKDLKFMNMSDAMIAKYT